MLSHTVKNKNKNKQWTTAGVLTGGSDFIEIDYERICEECQAIDPRYAVFATENPIIHVIKGRTIAVWTTLEKSIQCYQGLQKCHIPDSIYNALKDTEITRARYSKVFKRVEVWEAL